MTFTLRRESSMDEIRDSVEVALELDAKGVYSHIAEESAEDIRRIISSIDAERAMKKGFKVYYKDDWDELIRERIKKGKRHTAFDFYNPALLDIWEAKVKELKNVKKTEYFLYALIGATSLSLILTGLSLWWPMALLGLTPLPLVVWVHDRAREKRDLIYHQLAQFFIDEMRALLTRHSLDPEKFSFKVFNDDYFEVKTVKKGPETVAVVDISHGKG